MKRVIPALVPALFAVVLAGCGASASGPTGSTSASSADVVTTGPVAGPTSLAVETASPPPPEENNNGPSKGNYSPPPSVDFPVAPIGGGDGGSKESPRCVKASYLGERLPAGYEVHIKGSPQLEDNKAENGKPYFVVDGSGCGGAKRCGTGIVWTAKNSDDQCSVKLRYGGGTVPVGSDEVVRLSLAGTLICPKGQEQDCKKYVEDESDEQKIDVRPPEASSAVPPT